MSGSVRLILGGARSGKSRLAEQLARQQNRRVVFVATATAGDDEMAQRIARHRAARPDSWRTVEPPEDLVAAVEREVNDGDVVVVDCLTLWVSNVILGHLRNVDARRVPVEDVLAIEAGLLAATSELLRIARERGVTLILVSNEVGLGIVPPYPLGRAFRDTLGQVNQSVARQADSVILMIAGLPVDLRRLLPGELLPPI